MEIKSQVTIDKMLEQQAKINQTIMDMPVVRQDSVETTEYVDIEVFNTTSDTSVIMSQEGFYITRFIKSKLCKIEFSKAVKVIDIINYFDINDKLFVKMVSR